MRIVPATRAHALDLGRRLRPIDKLEIREATGLAPMEGLVQSLDASTTAYAALQGPRVFALYGVAPSPKNAATGIPWLLGSTELGKHRRDLLTVTFKVITEMQVLFPRLENYLSVENYTARRWLMWAGFEMVEHVQRYGIGQRPFIRFVKEAPLCAL